MKKAAILISVVCVLVFVLVGCADRYTNPESKELVVVNDTTEQIINMVSIQNYILSERVSMGPNALADGETILPGERMSFYLPPYANDVTLSIGTESEGYDSINFTYDYKVDGQNETITATYTETLVTDGTDSYFDGNIEVEGSNATEVK